MHWYCGLCQNQVFSATFAVEAAFSCQVRCWLASLGVICVFMDNASCHY